MSYILLSYAGHDGQSMVVRDATHNKGPLSCHPVLVCAHGDGPWGAKLACGCGQTSLRGCHRCGIVGATVAPNGDKLNSVAFGGASQQSEARIIGTDGTWQTFNFTYMAADGTFDLEAAKHIRFSDVGYKLRGNVAEQISEEELDSRAARAGASVAAGTVDLMTFCLRDRRTRYIFVFDLHRRFDQICAV